MNQEQKDLLIQQIKQSMQNIETARSEVGSNTELTQPEKGDKLRRLSIIYTHLETACLFTEKL